jgi:hypothetical protein
LTPPIAADLISVAALITTGLGLGNDQSVPLLAALDNLTFTIDASSACATCCLTFTVRKIALFTLTTRFGKTLSRCRVADLAFVTGGLVTTIVAIVFADQLTREGTYRFADQRNSYGTCEGDTKIRARLKTKRGASKIT